MSPRVDPTGIDLGEAARDYITAFRMLYPRSEQTENHGVAAGNGPFQPMTEPDDTDSNAQTYEDAYLEAAHYARPNAIAWTWLLPGRTPTLDTNMTRRGAMLAGGALVATAMTAGMGAAQSDLMINFESDYAHDPRGIADVTVAEHRPEFNEFGYVADDDSERTLGVASLASRDDGGDDDDDPEDPHNPTRIRGDKIEFSDARVFPRDLTTEDEDGDEEDGSALDAEFWIEDGLVVADDGDDLNVSGDMGTATFDEFTIDSGEQRRVLQTILSVNELGADATLDIHVTDASANQATVTVDSAADEADDHTVAVTQGPGVIFQQQLGDLDDGELLDTIVEIQIEVAGGPVDVTFHALNLESSSRWELGEREYLDEEDELDTETVYEESGYYGITSIETLYETDRLSDAVVYDVMYPDAELVPTDVQVDVDDGGRYDHDHRLTVLYSWDLQDAYDLDIEMTEWVDEVAHPSSRYLAMEIETAGDDVPELDDIDDIEWTSRTSTYADASIDDEVSLSSTVNAADVFTLHEYVLLSASELDDVTSEEGAAAGPTGREGGGWTSRIFSIPGAIASAVLGWGVFSLFRGR